MSEHLFIEDGVSAILLAAVITYGFRLGGLLLADRLPETGPLRTFLDGLPGAILLSLVVPGAIHMGITGVVGLGACLLARWKTGNLLVTMAAGVGTVAVLRHISFG